MKPELKQKWVEALRSGRYEQSEGYLRRVSIDTGNFSFCCLGVLCDLVKPNGWTKGEQHPMEHEDGACLNDEALEDVGLTNEEQIVLYRMNDGIGVDNVSSKQYSFDEIADYIEANL